MAFLAYQDWSGASEIRPFYTPERGHRLERMRSFLTLMSQSGNPDSPTSDAPRWTRRIHQSCDYPLKVLGNADNAVQLLNIAASPGNSIF
jgi:hypothetical protein